MANCVIYSIDNFLHTSVGYVESILSDCTTRFKVLSCNPMYIGTIHYKENGVFLKLFLKLLKNSVYLIPKFLGLGWTGRGWIGVLGEWWRKRNKAEITCIYKYKKKKMNKNCMHTNFMNTLLFTFSIIPLQLVPQNFISLFIYCNHIFIYIQQLLFAHFILFGMFHFI